MCVFVVGVRVFVVGVFVVGVFVVGVCVCHGHGRHAPLLGRVQVRHGGSAVV